MVVVNESRAGAREQFNQVLRGHVEARAMGLEVDPGGGYLVPQEWHETFLEDLATEVPYRQYCQVFQTSGPRIFPLPTFNQKAVFLKGGAISVVDPTVGAVAQEAHAVGLIVQLSEELVFDESFDLGRYLSVLFARAFGAAEDEAFTVGTGIGEPTGWTVDATTAVTAASALRIDADEVKALFFAVPAPYRRRGHWLMNDATLEHISTLKDSNGRYILTESNDGISRIQGRPVLSCESVPDIEAGASVVGFGDLASYVIIDRGQAVIQPLLERYTESAIVAYKLLRRIDGKLALPTGFQKLVMGSDGS